MQRLRFAHLPSCLAGKTEEEILRDAIKGERLRLRLNAQQLEEKQMLEVSHFVCSREGGSTNGPVISKAPACKVTVSGSPPTCIRPEASSLQPFFNQKYCWISPFTLKGP